MLLTIKKNRYNILFAFIGIFLFLSLLVRLALFFMALPNGGFTLLGTIKLLLAGSGFDLGVAVIISILYAIYLLVLPRKWNNSWPNRWLTYSGLALLLFIIMFSFFAEITFWQEFESRFNFIAVDYLIYTYEVVHNINESYPLPLLISGMILLVILIMWVLWKTGIFSSSFTADTSFGTRVKTTGTLLLLAAVFLLFIKNDMAERSNNRYENELSKAGIYSFFAAFKNNEINYDHFYQLINTDSAFQMIREDLAGNSTSFLRSGNSIRRFISNDSPGIKPNVIMITIESFSADFMAMFGNKKQLTPFLDSLAQKNMVFTQMYATGTRTIRGMEALSLSIPPTPGSSIVRRPDNNKLFTVGTVFKEAGYERTFLYGGDGYFDNMNQYFGGNGFNIIDHGRNLMVGDHFETRRSVIPADMVHFENAWGISDEDLYDAVIRDADIQHKAGKHFYDFVMTTSNHKPYTFPAGKIDLPSGSGREAAVKYTDYAISRFFEKARTKSWFNNTVIILVADHCASSAGKNEIDISKYHIPCIVVNNLAPGSIKADKMCSQIDLYPTLFAQWGWKYESNLYGKNVLADNFIPRAMMGTYQKLAYLKRDSLVILSPQQRVQTFMYNPATNQQANVQFPGTLVREAIASYQTAYFLYKNGGLKE